LASSFDGLTHFYPVDIYPENIAATEGLLTAFRRLQLLDGFGLTDHLRRGKYSLLHVDVSIYMSLLRILYSYSGMATLRHDLFLCFGLWHAYNYAHVALWHEFRATFLADAFWAIFPDQKLLRRPPLVQSSTFFTWIRLAYPHFRHHLIAHINESRTAMLECDIKLSANIEQGVRVEKLNPFRPIHSIIQSIYTFGVLYSGDTRLWGCTQKE